MAQLDLASLNKPQREAVRHTEGPLLVLAGAGSGKTRVITFRVAHLLQHHKIPAENILAVTFTNKAAAEMRERLAELVGRERCQGVTVSTFHSLGVRILRQEIGLLGYRKNFSIYDSSDQLGLLRQALREVHDGSRKVDVEALLWRISAAKNDLVAPERYRSRPGDADDLLAAAVYPPYQAALKACNAVDFDDLIMLTVRLFREHPEALARWQERYRYLLVDEYQDTNASQYLLVSLLAARHRNLCVVGDDDQSIYGWRGADAGRILAFEQDYPGCRAVTLEQNYRSTGTILAAANSVIRHNPVRKEKTLWTATGEGRAIDLVLAQDEEEEATLVVERLQVERAARNLEYGDFAILYRTNAQSRPFEEQLRFAGIPYVLIGGMQFYERKEVKDTLAYLKVIANAEDEQALLRIVNFPRRGIGDTTVTKIIQWSLAQGCSLTEAFARVGEIEGVTTETAAKVLAFSTLLAQEGERFRPGGSLAEKAASLIKRLGLTDELYRTINDPATARRKVENVEQVVNSLAAYEEKGGRTTLGGFLEKVALLDEDRFAGKDRQAGSRDAVTLMSLHASKGLEFPHVFLVGLEEEILPHRKSLDAGGTLDEERRLCYVGITRARRHLTLTRCLHRKKYGKKEERGPSRFLAEIPAELVNEQSGAAAPILTEEESAQLAGSSFARLRGLFGE